MFNPPNHFPIAHQRQPLLPPEGGVVPPDAARQRSPRSEESGARVVVAVRVNGGRVVHIGHELQGSFFHVDKTPGTLQHHCTATGKQD